MEYCDLALYISGEWRAGRRRTRPVINPASEDVIGELPLATAADLEDALQAVDRTAAAAAVQMGVHFGLQQSQSAVGWTVGVGAEVGIYQNWTAKIEYLYVNLSSNDYTLTGAKNGLDFGTVRLGVNYHF